MSTTASTCRHKGELKAPQSMHVLPKSMANRSSSNCAGVFSGTFRLRPPPRPGPVLGVFFRANSLGGHMRSRMYSFRMSSPSSLRASYTYKDELAWSFPSNRKHSRRWISMRASIRRRAGTS
ncbi:hypothetical protein H257_01776 [Aphanomyces astaci]|uniref:Uncharacterized protein n=1 Tax=Aphanomyces astaci TaxID=112090 RepID=W4H4Y1_APHAT|nr:hypothetical protein H257_01776 [Aphanomyces astaci]ETV86651.1 hypothetical protein H257_01776 [Aphanomyces astaci]|eukprot:XP_009823450.1 hypothetical protein H257_01776 [Aphanomyces astaci]